MTADCRRPAGRAPVPPGAPAGIPVTIPPRWTAVLTALLAALALWLPSAASAQTIKPWVPPSADSLLVWSAEAKVRFQENKGDTVGGSNYRAYELVGIMGRKLLRSLGRRNLLQANAVEPVIDSLGLDTTVELDPHYPDFVLMVVRNPYKLTAHAVAFIYWYRGNDFRMQGALVYGGIRPSMRVWWTGYKDQPYSLGLIEHDRGHEGGVRVTILRMLANASAWDVLQFPGDAGLAGPGEAAWVDLDNDERPELVAWLKAKNDTLFTECADCPFIIHERTFTERRDGLSLHDMRILPSPYATFTLFIRLLSEGNRPAASRLLRHPEKLAEAEAAGWGSRKRAGAWFLEYGEDDTWPRWLAFVHHGARGDTRYIVHFELEEGRWIISDWVIPHAPVAKSDSTAAGKTAPSKAAPAKTAPTKSGKKP